MVSPKLLLLYSSTWKNILKAGGPLGHDLIQFAKTLAALREALTCSVCGKLLTGDELYSPSASSSCNHFSCKDCKGGDRKDSYSCEFCRDWEVYREDETLSFLMQGYRQLCRYFLRSKECTRVLEVKYEVDAEFDAFQLLDLLVEGSRQYRAPKLTGNEFNTVEDHGVVPIRKGTKSFIISESQITEVVIDQEEERKFEIDIKMEPVESMQFHEVIVEQEEEIRTNDLGSLENQCQTITTLVPVEDSLSNDLDVQEEELEDDNEEEEIRSSSLRLASPPPPPLPQPAQQQPTSIIFQRTPQSMGGTQQIQLSSKQVQSFVLAGSGNSPARQIQFTGARIPGTSTFRFARLSLDGRPLTMVRHVLGQSTSPAAVRHTVTLPINASTLAKKKIIVRPATSGTINTNQIQKWPDANKVLQYASGGTLLPPGTTISTPRATYSTVTSSVASSSTTEFRPQQVTKISLGNMGAVVSTSSLSTAINRPATLTTSSGKIIGTIGTVVRTDTMSSDGTIKKLKVRLPKPKMQPKIRKGCRCGNAATQPGKLTCCGQRCPCYVDAKSCTDCRCRGCRNPHLPGGKKLLQGINAVIDTKTNTTVPLSVNITSTSGANSSSSSMTVARPAGTIVPIPITSSTMNLVPVSASQMYSRIHYPGTTHATTTSYSQLIPLANFGGFSIPISLISPASHATTSIQSLQTHGQPIRMQCIQSINNTMAANIKSETYNRTIMEDK